MKCAQKLLSGHVNVAVGNDIFNLTEKEQLTFICFFEKTRILDAL
jgi:hypothetical protein